MLRNITRTLRIPVVRKFGTLVPEEKKYTIDDYEESVLSLSNLKLDSCRDLFKNDTISVLGYGPQGRGQSLNLRDNGYPVILGLRKGKSWTKALEDGWIENKNLFSIEDSLDKGTVIQYLLSDSAQSTMWSDVNRTFLENNTAKPKTLYFSHGFGIVFSEQTGIVPPKDIDIIMVAPKGPGGLVRENFLKGNKGINASYAIHQDVSGDALDKCISLSYGIGSKNLFKTTFEKEVYSDLTGERCVLMGLIQGAFKAQYDVLRENGHSPMECFNETVEEGLQSLYPLINEKGMDWMFSNCSTTAQRGALDWSKIFYQHIKPVITHCYHSVRDGEESKRSIENNSDPDYRGKLELELEEIDDQEIWKVGKLVRELRN